MGGGSGGPYGGHMSQNLHWNTQFLRFYKNHYIIGLGSERAGSRTLEKFSRWDRDCAKFESSRRFGGSNMNPKKKLRRCWASVSIQALDLAISRFIHSLGPNYTICPRRYCCQIRTTDRNNRPILHKFQPQGGNEYIVHSAQLAGSFWVLRQNLQQVARNQGKPHKSLCLLGSSPHSGT